MGFGRGGVEMIDGKGLFSSMLPSERPCGRWVPHRSPAADRHTEVAKSAFRAAGWPATEQCMSQCHHHVKTMQQRPCPSVNVPFVHHHRAAVQTVRRLPLSPLSGRWRPRVCVFMLLFCVVCECRLGCCGDCDRVSTWIVFWFVGMLGCVCCVI